MHLRETRLGIESSRVTLQYFFLLFFGEGGLLFYKKIYKFKSGDIIHKIISNSIRYSTFKYIYSLLDNYFSYHLINTKIL